MGKTENSLLSLLAGIAVGALAGVLLAPDKGEKTREKIAKKSSDLKKDLEDQVEVSKNKIYKFAESIVNPVKEGARDMEKRAENAADAMVKKVKDTSTT